MRYVVEGQVYLEYAAGQTRGPVPDGLHYWKISQIVPGRGRTGHATPIGPLYGPGLSEGGDGEGDYRLLKQSTALPPSDPP